MAKTRRRSQPKASEPPVEEIPQRPRLSDPVVAALVALGAAAVFASTFSGHVGFGDAPESVAGVKSLGILHAPGYPAYVLAARAFATIEPFGTWAFRVNLFSVVCASLTIGIVFLIARRIGANVTGAVIGSFTLATGVSFWFNADFAKHYAFSALLVAVPVLLVLIWQETGRTLLFMTAAAVIGIGAGASWQLAAIMAAGLVALILLGERRPRLGEWIGAGALSVLVAIGLLVYLVVRARQDPTLNWGDARDVRRLLDLVMQKDFRLGTTTTITGQSVVSRILPRSGVYLGVISRECGLGAIVVALVGAFRAYSRCGRAHTAFLGVVAVTNFVAAIVAAGLESLDGFQSSLIVGGFLVDLFIVIALLVAVGASEMVDATADWLRAHPSRLREFRMTPTRARTGIVVALLLVVIAPSAIVHYDHASHREPAFVDDYARRVLDALPPNAVLIVGGFGYGEPIPYRQIVDGERPDVTFIDGGTTPKAWYRDQLTRRYHLGDTLSDAPDYQPLTRLVAYWRKTRPVYLDTSAMALLRTFIGYRAEGFVGVVVDGTFGHPGKNLDAIAAEVERADVEDHLEGRPHPGFPNDDVYTFHERAHIELAKQYYADKRIDAVERELRRAIAVLPLDPAPRTALQLLLANSPDVADVMTEL